MAWPKVQEEKKRGFWGRGLSNSLSSGCVTEFLALSVKKNSFFSFRSWGQLGNPGLPVWLLGLRIVVSNLSLFKGHMGGWPGLRWYGLSRGMGSWAGWSLV